MEFAAGYGALGALAILVDAGNIHEGQAASLATDSGAFELGHDHRLESRDIVAVVDDEVTILVLALAQEACDVGV